MDWLRRFYYLDEIEWQCATALTAFDSLPAPDETEHESIDCDVVYRAIQAGMAAAANISKMLWSTSNPGRAEDLRAELEVEENSPISSRTLRNHFEHFDERLDKWVDDHAQTQSIVNRNVQPVTEDIRERVETGWVLHQYDPISRIAYFRGEQFPIAPVVQELRRILDLCRTFYPIA